MPKKQHKFKYFPLFFTKKGKIKRKHLFSVLGFLITATVMGFLTFWTFSQMVSSDSKSKLHHENETLKANYNLLEKKVDNLNLVLNDIQNRDDNLYRFLLNADAIPSEIRNSGMGGINRYKNIEQLPEGELIKRTTEKLDNLIKKAYIQSKSFDEVENLANLQKKMLTSIPAIMPIRKELLRSRPGGYGRRLHPVYGVYRMHKGMDFSVPSGSDIYATGDGIVTKVKRDRGYGIYVVIKHNYGGYETRYAHMMRAKAKVGQRVKRGTVIGYVGNTGVSTAPHVHYEVRRNGKILNPINFYNNDLTPEEYEQIIHDTNNSVQSFD